MTTLPPYLHAFLRPPRAAVMATTRPDGAPASVPCWYGWNGDEIRLSMHRHAARVRNLRRDPRLSLTVLGPTWYQHLTLVGEAVRLYDDVGLRDLDVLSRRYRGEPHADRSHRMVTAVVRVDRWHSFGLEEPA